MKITGINRTRVIRLNPKNTERLNSFQGEYDDVNDLISKIFDKYEGK